MTNGARTKWTPELVARLGEETDTVIAKELGISVSTVCEKRLQLGIPRATYSRSSKWTPDVVARLGRDTDKMIAQELGISISAVSEKRGRLGIPRSEDAALEERRWTEDEDALLGTMFDRLVARELGIGHSTVERRRVKLGIPPFVPGYPRQVSELVGAQYVATREHNPRWSITEIAEAHHVTPQAVTKAIARYEQRKAKTRRRSHRTMR